MTNKKPDPVDHEHLWDKIELLEREFSVDMNALETKVMSLLKWAAGIAISLIVAFLGWTMKERTEQTIINLSAAENYGRVTANQARLMIQSDALNETIIEQGEKTRQAIEIHFNDQYAHPAAIENVVKHFKEDSKKAN